MYKPSKFNFIHKCENGELRLYNSMEGTKSLAIIPPDSAGEVVSLLKNGAVSGNGDREAFLIEHGFLVPVERDEESRRRLRMMEETTDSTLELIILPTEQCNFRCKYCYETFEKGKMDMTIQDALIKYVRKNIHRFTALNVGWFGGEPLEALDVISRLSEEFIKICKTARKHYSADMTTNGYNLTLEIYNKLIKYKVNSYQITLDGLETEHDRQRVLVDGSGTFRTIVRNLLDIKNQTRPFNTSIAVRTNYTKKIVDDLEHYIQFYSANFGDDPRFSIFIHMASNLGGERVKDFCEELLPHSQYSTLVQKIHGLKIPLNYQIHFNHLNFSSFICYASKKNSIIIGSDGILYKCTSSFNYDKNKVGVLSNNGELRYNENYYLWPGVSHVNDKKCENCFYGACCLSMKCPAVRIKGLDNGACSLEKEHMGIFLGLFGEEYFSTYKEGLK